MKKPNSSFQPGYVFMKKIVQAILISILALFLRSHMAYYGPIEPDEPGYVTAASMLNRGIRQGDWSPILKSSYNIEHPQFYKLVYAVGLMAGNPIHDTDAMQPAQNIQSVGYWYHLFFLRMISVVIGTATVFLISLISPLAGLFLAIHTFDVKFTSVIYLEALPQFTSLVALLSALQAQKAFMNHSENWKRWGGWLLLSSLTMGMTVASKYIYGFIGLVIVVVILLQGWKSKTPFLFGLLGWGLFAIAFFFLFDPILWHSPLTEIRNSIEFSINYSMSKAVRDVSYPIWQPIKWLMISIPQQPIIPITAFFVNKGDFFILADSLIFVLALIGQPMLFMKNKPMFLWLITGMTFLFCWKTKWPQYILPVLIPFCVSAAYGYNWLRQIVNEVTPKIIMEKLSTHRQQVEPKRLN